MQRTFAYLSIKVSFFLLVINYYLLYPTLTFNFHSHFCNFPTLALLAKKPR